MGRLRRLLDRVPDTRPGREQALRTTERLGAVTHLLNSLERLGERPEQLQYWGGRSRTERRAWRSDLSPLRRRVADAAADPRGIRAMHTARAGAALVLLAPTGRRARFAANALLAGTSFVLYPLQPYGSDGSDQSSFVVQAAATVARAADDRPGLVDVALWYVAAQGTLSYAVSGWMKLLGSTWRRGRALHDIMRTHSYGDPTVFALVQRFPRSSRIVTFGVLAMECLFPVAYLAGGRFGKLFVGSAAFFHLVNARVMGLSRFVPGFLALHPALLYTSGPREALVGGRTERRDDLFLSVLAGTGAAGLAYTAYAYLRRRRAVSRGSAGEQTFTASTGNTLRYRRSGSGDPDTPLVVVENGLGGTLEQGAWLHRHLERRYDVLTYNRAGYGSSGYGWVGDYTLDVAVRDLAELVADQAGERPVVVVGQSIGGYLAWMSAPRLAAELGPRFRGIALLDSTHPDEMFRSPAQHAGAKANDRIVGETAISLKLGMGVLMAPHDWVETLPEDVRSLVRDQFADPGLWTAMRREWRALREHLASPAGRLTPIDVPVAVLTAERTATSEPVQVELHDEMAAAAPWALRRIVPRTSHGSMVAEEEPAGRTIDIVAEFVDAVVAGTPEAVAAVRTGPAVPRREVVPGDPATNGHRTSPRLAVPPGRTV